MNGEEEALRVRPSYAVKITETPKFDLPLYITNYRGRTVFRRLYLIASCSTVLAEEAARLALAEAKKGSDVNNYLDALELLKSLNIDTTSLADPAWQQNQEKKNAAESKRLQNELKQYKNNLIRESIRMGNEEIGSHYYAIGQLSEAVKAYSGMRDYCTTPSQVAANGFRLISVAIEQQNWLAVQSRVTSIRSYGMKAEEAARTQPKVCTASGLCNLALGNYEQAAQDFLDTDPSLGDTYNEVISANDIAVYGGLCALASMNRAELQSKVLENNNFRSFLELEPHIRRAVNAFCASKYQQCLEILEAYRADYLLDIYLQDQLMAIYQRIRTKSIVQYFQPFSRVTLASMQDMFSTEPRGSTSISPQFLSELIQMISSGQLNARIDLEHNVLVAHDESSRAVMQQKALDTVDAFIREARIKLLRLNAVNNDLVVKAEKKRTGGQLDLASDEGIDTVFNGNGEGSGFAGQGSVLGRA